VPQLEKQTERMTGEYAREQGCLAVKLTIWGRRGWPDYLFLYHGRALFIEFKRTGEKPRKLQEYIHGLIREHGFQVAVVDNLIEGRLAINHLTGGGSDI
jgi:hypothetical protein